MQDGVRLYFRYIGVSIRAQMQYKASFLMMAFGNFFTILVEFLGIWVLFARFGNLKGWSLAEIGLFYGVTNIGFAFADGLGRGFDRFSLMVKSGDFDRLLLRPRPTAFQVAAQEWQLMRVGRLIQGSMILGWAVTSLPIAWTAAKVALLGGMIVGVACLFYGLFVLQATLSFWTVETLEIMNIVTYGGTETAQFPLTIYPTWFRRIFTFLVPFACMNYLPASQIFGGHKQLSPETWHWFAPLAGVLFLCLCFQVWKLGERRYRSTGT